jgi:azurin
MALATVMLISCGGNQSEQHATHETHTSETPAKEANTTAPATASDVFIAPEGPEAVITIHAGDDMKFDLKEIRVKQGQKVKLTLQHSGKMDKKAMGHNVVIIPNAMDLQLFANEAMKDAENDYVPASEAKQIIAHTKMVGGGETTTIEFEAPAPGVYKYVCTFPGHWAAMNGKFFVD